MSFVLGGLLGGLGQGLSMQAMQNREDALERLRAARQIDTESRLEQRTIAQEGREEQRGIAKEGRDFEYKKGLLGETARYKADEDVREIEGRVRVEQTKTQGDLTLEAVKARNAQRLESMRQAGDLRLEDKKAALEFEAEQRKRGNDITEFVTAENGQLMGVTADGTTIAVKGERNGKRVAIKVLQKDKGDDEDDYAPRRGRETSRGTSPAPAAPAPSPKAPAKPQGKTISSAELSNLYNAAMAKAANQVAGYKGLNNAQIKAKVDAMLRAQGYTVQ